MSKESTGCVDLVTESKQVLDAAIKKSGKTQQVVFTALHYSKSAATQFLAPMCSNKNLPFYVIPNFCHEVGNVDAIEWLANQLSLTCVPIDIHTIYQRHSDKLNEHVTETKNIATTEPENSDTEALKKELAYYKKMVLEVGISDPKVLEKILDLGYRMGK